MKDQPPPPLAICPSCHASGTLAAPCLERVCKLRGYHFVPLARPTEQGEAPPLDSYIGQVLSDSYLLIDLIGVGGFGRVYRGLKLPMKVPIAVKILDSEASTADFAQLKLTKFDVEAHALARLSHPNIVRFDNYGQHRGTHYLAMELVENATTLWGEIEARAHAKQPFTLDEIETILLQVLAALEAAHASNMIHRDIKPENIMLQRGVPGHGLFVKVLDFGLAKFSEDRSATSMLLGTPGYMAHEQLTRGALGPWTDLYALAVLAFELLTGHRPYPGSSVQETLSYKLDQNYNPWSRVEHLGLPAEIRNFFSRALERDPYGRYRDTQEMRQALERTLQEMRQRVGPHYQVELQRLVAPTEFHASLDKVPDKPPSEPVARTRQHQRPPSDLSHHTAQHSIPIQLRSTPSHPLPEPLRETPKASHWQWWALGALLLGGGAGTIAYLNLSTPHFSLTKEPLTPLVTIVVKAGSFESGSAADSLHHRPDERLHRVTLTRDIGVTSGEITQQHWREGFGSNPAVFKECGPTCPVENVSWWDALAYANLRSELDSLQTCYQLEGCQGTPGRSDYTCQQAIFKGLDCTGWRLPTEAEWEYLASSLSQLVPDVSLLSPLAWHQANSDVTYTGAVTCTDGDPARRCGPHPVRQLKDNPPGIFDLLGNVREWVFDGYASYPDSEHQDPLGPTSAPERVIRGGSFNSPLAQLRSAARDHALPTVRAPDLGFRLVRTLATEP